MVVLAKFWGVQLPSGHKIAKICMPPGGQLSMRKWRDRECTYSAVGLPAFFNDNDIMFPVEKMLLSVALKSLRCIPRLEVISEIMVGLTPLSSCRLPAY